MGNRLRSSGFRGCASFLPRARLETHLPLMSAHPVSAPPSRALPPGILVPRVCPTWLLKRQGAEAYPRSFINIRNNPHFEFGAGFSRAHPPDERSPVLHRLLPFFESEESLQRTTGLAGLQYEMGVNLRPMSAPPAMDTSTLEHLELKPDAHFLRHLTNPNECLPVPSNGQIHPGCWLDVPILRSVSDLLFRISVPNAVPGSYSTTTPRLLVL